MTDNAAVTRNLGIKIAPEQRTDRTGKGQPVRWKKGGIEFREGDLISLKIHNRSRHSIDFSLLFIDSGFGIDPIFPPPDTVVDNRLKPGRSFTIGPLKIEGDSFGMEHVVLIALKAAGQQKAV